MPLLLLDILAALIVSYLVGRDQWEDSHDEFAL
jgi:hypothetical protein